MPPKPKNSAEAEHAVPCELIELAKFEVFVLQDQALGGGKCHGERVLSHRLGITAAVRCHWHTLPASSPSGMKSTPPIMN